MHTCIKCGALEEAGYIKETKTELIERQLCFKCNFWFGKILIKDEPNVARIAGTHYVIGPDDDSPSNWRGFGGQRHRIRFLDGRVVITTNLWTQGKIPENFRNILVDNAEFA